MRFSGDVARRFAKNFLLFRCGLAFSWIGVGLLRLLLPFEIIGMGRISVAKKDSKIEGLAVSAVFLAKLFV